MSHVDPPTVNVLSLAAGAGGLDLGIRVAIPTSRTVCFVEIEAYACEVLASRMEEGRLDDAPIWSDLRTFDGRAWRGVVDLVVAGYPCQPFSKAGGRRGAEDPRHLWPHVLRVLEETGAPWIFVENVRGHLSLGFEQVWGELRDRGFQVEAGLYSAAEVGAPHRRERLFALAHANGDDPRRLGEAVACALPRGAAHAANGGAPALACREDVGGRALWPPGPEDFAAWSRLLRGSPDLEPALPRGDARVADWVERMRVCGNGVVPLQAARAFSDLYGRF